MSADLAGGSGTSVTRRAGTVVKRYRPGFDDGSRLGVGDTAAKAVLLAAELPVLGIPIPRVVEHRVEGDEAVVVSEEVPAEPFTPAHRVAAARVLRRLHGIDPAVLSPDLADLIDRSAPNRDRIRLGVEGSAAALDGSDPGWRESTLGRRIGALLAAGEPPPGRSLVHGDYFSVNVLAVGRGVKVIDWDLAGRGDPMWDLGFLIGADRDLPDAQVDDVLDAYGREAIEERSLGWHRECWSLFWLLRDRERAAGE